MKNYFHILCGEEKRQQTLRESPWTFGLLQKFVGLYLCTSFLAVGGSLLLPLFPVIFLHSFLSGFINSEINLLPFFILLLDIFVFS